jgi:hypothetical protein
MPKDVDYNALIKKDADGKVQPLSGPLYVEALKVNTKVPADFWDKAKPYLAERRQTMEFVMINNLDLMDKIEDGIFESTGFDKTQVDKLLSTARPLLKPAAPDVLSKELKAKGLLDETQYRVTETLVRNYVLAKNPIPKEDTPKEERGNRSFGVLIQLYKIPFDEFVHIHHDLTTVAADNMRDILPMAGVDDATASKVREVMSGLKKDASFEQKSAAMKGLRDVLTMDQRKEVLKQAATIWRAQHEK